MAVFGRLWALYGGLPPDPDDSDCDFLVVVDSDTDCGTDGVDTSTDFLQ